MMLPFPPEQLMLLIVGLPTIAAIMMPIAGKYPNLRDSISLLVGSLVVWHVWSLWHAFQIGDVPPITLTEIMPGLAIAFALEPIGMIFAGVSSTLWVITTLYAIGYMRGNHEVNQTRFFACFALSITCATGIALSANLLTTFIFYEAMTLLTYPLVTHSGTAEARRSGRVYLGILMGTSIGLFFPAMLWSYYLTGTVDYQAHGSLVGMCTPWMALMLALFMFGTGKAALMPFHRWLPAAMVAPTPVSALLHAVAVVKAGVFVVVKVIIYVFGTDHLIAMNQLHGDFISGWLVYIAGFTVVLGSVIALRQDNLKKRLAYSTISQLSYVTMAAALLTPYAILGAVLHIAAHAFGKITLFFAAGSIYTASGKKNVSELDGIGRVMPITMTAFAIASLSMIGLPPTVGFLSKWYMLKGIIDAEHYFALGVIAVSTLLNVAYLLPIVYRAFFRPPSGKKHGEAPWPIVVAISFTAIGCLALFFFPDILMDLGKQLLPNHLRAF